MNDGDEDIDGGREPYGDGDPSVSDLVVRVNEPDVYTPTLDLSDDPAMRVRHDLLRQAATRPGVRRALRSEGEDHLALVPTDEKEALEELRGEMKAYEEASSPKNWRPWVWCVLSVLAAVGLVILFGRRE